jgi:hypothetical protein
MKKLITRLMQDNINVVQLNFADIKLPELVKTRSKPYLKQGEDHDFPKKLLYLFNKSAKHNAIINGKVNYIFGGGLKPLDELNMKAVSWERKVNNYGETLNDLTKKAITDLEIFGGFYWQIIPNLSGDFEIYHLEYSKVLSNKEGTEFFYKHDWADEKEAAKPFDGFNPDKLAEAKPMVFFYSEYRPGLDVYPLPGYLGAVNYIESDVEVSKWTLNKAQKGFSATKFINFYNGEPSAEKKREITNKFKTQHEGGDGETVIIAFNTDPTKKPTIDDLGASDLTKEDFSKVDNLISQNIYAGHQITSPMLFGIKTEGQLGGSTELRTAYEIFKNTYVKAKQQQIEKVVNFFAAVKGIGTTYTTIQTEPVGLELGSDVVLQVAPKSWVLEKLGIDPTLYPDAPAIAGGTQPELMVNDTLKGLSGREYQNLMRIVRQYGQGKVTKEQALTMMRSGYGLSDEEIFSMLGIDETFSSEFNEEQIAAMFTEVGERKDFFSKVDSEPVYFSSNREAMESELLLREEFAEQEVTKKKISDIQKITGVIPRLYIKYSYEAKEGLKPIIETTRPFCRKLIEVDKYWSRKEIELISERVGYSVWDRKGGFWGKSAECRHRWVRNVLVKIK